VGSLPALPVVVESITIHFDDLLPVCTKSQYVTLEEVASNYRHLS